MAKLIKLKLCQIKYSGDSIGDDIRVEMEIYNALIKARKGDFVSVGVVEVID